MKIRYSNDKCQFNKLNRRKIDYVAQLKAK